MLLSAQEISGLLPSKPLLSSRQNGLVVEHYKHPPSVIETPASSNALLVVHLSGPYAVEEKTGAGWTRKWADKHHVSVTPPGASVVRRFQAWTEILLFQLDPCLINGVIEEAFDIDPRQATLTPCLANIDPTLDQVAHLLAAEVRKPVEPGHTMMMEALGRAITLALLRGHSTLGQAPAEEPLRIAPVRIRRVLEYLREEQPHNPTLNELASLAGLSPTHFGRAFRATTGVPPHKYLLELRMEQARRLLGSTKLSVMQIAWQCGFEQSTSFATAFKKLIGVSPRTWRAERQS